MGLLIAACWLANPAALRAEPLYILSTSGVLNVCDPDQPSTCSFGNFHQVFITGLPAGETIVAIDFRPSTGALYGLTRTAAGGRIYLIDHLTGAAQPVGDGTRFPLTGSEGFDFDPTTDRIRITTTTGQNLTVNPDDGTAVSGTQLAYAANDVNAGRAPQVQDCAYTNNFAGARATALYGIDTASGVLVIQHPPDSGTLRTVGSAGLHTGSVGFDVSGLTGTAYVIYGFGPGELYKIDLVTGAHSFIANVFLRPDLSDSPRDLAATVAPASRLLNIATRGRVGTGDDVLIAGFISREGKSARYLLRAIGPSLSPAVSSPLPDPVLTLYDKNGIAIVSNDDWRSSQQAQIIATTLAPTNDKEAAIFASLAPDSYTAIVSGKNGATGLAVVEVYQLP